VRNITGLCVYLYVYVPGCEVNLFLYEVACRICCIKLLTVHNVVDTGSVPRCADGTRRLILSQHLSIVPSRFSVINQSLA